MPCSGSCQPLRLWVPSGRLAGPMLKPLFCFFNGRPPSSSWARFGAMVRQAAQCWCRKNAMIAQHGLAERESFWCTPRLPAWRQRRRAVGGGRGLCCHPSVTRLHPASLRANDGPVRRPGVAIWRFTRGHYASRDASKKGPTLRVWGCCLLYRRADAAISHQPQELRASPLSSVIVLLRTLFPRALRFQSRRSRAGHLLRRETTTRSFCEAASGASAPLIRAETAHRSCQHLIKVPALPVS